METKNKRVFRVKAMLTHDEACEFEDVQLEAGITGADLIRRALTSYFARNKGDYDYLEFEDAERAKLQQWLNYYIVEEDFEAKHLETINKIVSRFNWDRPTEQSIFDFADGLGGN